MSEPEEIFTSALEVLYNEVPVTVATTHGVYTHERAGEKIVTIRVPETEAANWGLQADGVWQASVYLADHLPRPLVGKRVLELGAGAGLPGIVAAFGIKGDEPGRVVLSDYPDEGILAQLKANVESNRGESGVQVEVVGHAWGAEGGLGGEFDVVLAADVLWMGEVHEALCRTLDRVLGPEGRVHIVAGMHTGRGVISSFLATAARHKLQTAEIYEVSITDPSVRREWCRERAGEGMGERRGCVAWCVDEEDALDLRGMPALPFPAPTAGPALSPWSEYTVHDGGGTPLDIPIDPALLDDGDGVVGVEYVDAMEGVMAVGPIPWVGGCAVDDHRYHNLDIPPPPSLEEQQAQLPPTPPLSLSQPKHDRKRRRKPKQPPQPLPQLPPVETECSFCQGDDESNKHGVPEKMASCAACGRSGHPSCIQIPHLADVIRTYEWRCQECKECEICHSKGDDSKMLFCDLCDRGWHFDCLTPPLGRAPRGKWSCPLCAPRPSTSTAQSASKSAAAPPAPPPSKQPLNKSRRKSVPDPINSKSRSKSPTQLRSKRGVPFPVLTPETDDIHLEVERQTSPTPPPPEDPPEAEPAPASPRVATVSPQRTTTLRFKRTPTHPPAPSSSPTRPLKVRIRVTSKSDTEGPAKADGDTSEGANDPFGGILSTQEADISKTTIIPNDKERFEAARVASEARIHKSTSYFTTPHTPRPVGSSSTYQLPGYVPPTRTLRSLPLRTGSPPPTTPTISTPGGILPPKAALPADNGLRIKTIRFGQFDIDTWYDAPFPEEFSNIPEGRLWMCEFCLKYMRSGFQAGRHKMKCKMRCPPGDEIYRDGAISVFEVDGRKNKIYCQNLCLLSKMFLDHKSLFYDVEPFLFYVMTLVDDDGARFVGYFSKEKSSPKDYNVSCIMTLPVRQRQGWGNLLIDFSYLLSKKEGRTGTPERPLSALGALSYKNYWKLTIMLFLHKAQGRVRIRDISAATSITLEDTFETLRENKLITGPGITPSSAAQSALPRKRGPGRPPRHVSDKKDDGHGHEPSTPVVLPRKYSIRWNAEEVDAYVQNWERKGHLRLKPDRLKWVPYRLTRAPVVPLVLPSIGEDAAERSESDDEPVSDGSEDLGAPIPTPALVINTLIPRPKTRSRVPTSHPSDDDADADEDDDHRVPHSMTRRSRSRQSTLTPGRFDTPERRSLRSAVLGSTIITRKASLQSHLGIGRRESPEATPVALRSRTRSMQHLRVEQTTPMRRTSRGRPPPKGKPDSDKEPSPPVVPRKSRRSPVRKRRRIESSPEASVTSSPGKTGADTNGRDNDAEGSPDEDGSPPPSAEQRVERSRSVSLGSGMVYDVRPEPPAVNGAIDVTPAPAPSTESNGATPSTEPACPFTSDDGSPLTSVKEELTDDASEGPTLTADMYDDDALGDEDAEGEPDEDAEGEVDESIL